MRKLSVAAAAAVLALTVSGCADVAGALGDSCKEFNNADANRQQEMVLEWMKDNGLAPDDAEMTDPGDTAPLLGFDVMGWTSTMAEHCAGNPSDGLYELSPSYG